MNVFSWISQLDATLLAGGLFFLGSLMLVGLVVFTRRPTAPLQSTPEDALRQSKERLQLLVDRMPIACITWNADFTVGLWNPEAERIFGYTEQDAVGKHAFDLIVPDDAQSFLLSVWKKLMSGEESAHSENENITRDGATIICAWYNTPLKNDHGETIGVISMVRDVTKKRRAEQSVRHAAELQQIILNAIPAPIFFKDAAGVYLGCNDAFVEYLGLKPEQIVGHTAFDIAPVDKANIYEEADKRLLQVGGIQIYEAKVLYADGLDHDVVFHKAVYQNPDGTIGGIVGNMLDVSDIRKAEVALTEVEQSYREIFNASGEAIILRDVQTGRIVDVNRSMLEMYGCSYEEALKATFADLSDGTPPYTTEQAKQKVQQALEGKPQLFEWRAKRKDGTRFWAEIALTRSTISGQERTLAVVRDVTERKEADQDRKESEERYRKISQEFSVVLDGIPDAMMLIDSDLKVVWGNKGAGKHFGVVPGEVKGDVCNEVWGAAAEKCRDSLKEVFRTGKTQDLIQELPDGRVMGVKNFPVADDKGVIANIVQIASDLTEKAKLREQATRSARLAAIGELAAGVAHEVNNPIGMILLDLPLLKDVFTELIPLIKEHPALQGDEKIAGLPLEKLFREIPSVVDEVFEGALKVKRIVEELRDFSRPTKGVLEPVDISEVARKAVRMVRNPLKNATDFFTETYSPLPLLCLGDPNRLEQVVVNLLLNACQSLPDKHAKISIETKKDGASGSLQLIVQDEGCGVDPLHIKNITDPFYTSKRDTGGTGLGLSVSSRIISEHKGLLGFQSQPGQGTTVVVELPMAEQG